MFQARLEEIRKDYGYDSQLIESVPIVAALYDSIVAIINQEEGLNCTNSISDLVIKNEMIETNLKPTVLLILAAMLLGEQFSRTVDDEAKRWENVPFENWPKEIKEKGVLVRHQGIRIRISANHLKKRVDKIFVDALVSHYQQKAKDFSQSVRFWTPRVLGVVLVAALAKKALDRL